MTAKCRPQTTDRGRPSSVGRHLSFIFEVLRPPSAVIFSGFPRSVVCRLRSVIRRHRSAVSFPVSPVCCQGFFFILGRRSSVCGRSTTPPPPRLSANLLSKPSFPGPVNSLLDAFRADSVSRPGIVEGKFLSNLTMTFQTDNFHGSISSLSRTSDHRSWTAFKNKCLLTLFSKTANIYLF